MTGQTLPMEPSLDRYRNPMARYFAATRPPFLTATLVACLIGLASAGYGGVSLNGLLVLVTLLLAMTLHAAANVLNDYYDALNGTDASNTERLFPFTGGSRFIQNGVLTDRQTGRYGYALLALAVAGGLWLAVQCGGGLLVIGACGVLVGWAYSAKPLSLNSRGWGEWCVFAGFLGVVVGADFVQRQAFAWQPVWTGLPYALLVTNLLYINQFPDRKADAAAGKRHWVVRLSPERAALGYPMIVFLALAGLSLAVMARLLPALAMLSALPLGLSLVASRELIQFATVPAKLLPAIRLTLAAMLAHGVLLTLILFLEAP